MLCDSEAASPKAAQRPCHWLKYSLLNSLVCLRALRPPCCEEVQTSAMERPHGETRHCMERGRGEGRALVIPQLPSAATAQQPPIQNFPAEPLIHRNQHR